MVSLLARNNYKLLTYVTDCLHLMIYGNQESKYKLKILLSNKFYNFN